MKATAVRFREKISYLFSAMGYELEAMLIASYFTLFCTDVMLIDAAKVGVVFLVVKVFDGITDILITNLADKTRTRWGKYRPWLLAGIPLAIFMFLCFLYPGFLHTETQKLIWVIVLLIITVSIFETSYMCPFLVLNAVMSENPKDRLHFATAKTIGENTADFIVSGSVMSIILAFGGYKDITGWRVMGVVFAVATLLCTLIGFSGIRERVEVSNLNQNGEVMKLREKFVLLKNHWPFYKLLAVQSGYQIVWFGTMTMFSYFSIYVLCREDWVSILSTIGIVAQIITSALTSTLAQRYQKRSLIFIGAGLLAVSGIALAFTNSFFMAVVYQVLRGCGIGLIYICNYALWPEIVDYTTKKTGVVCPGIIYSVESFFTKISIVLGAFTATMVLEWGGYDSQSYVQSTSTTLWIRYAMVAMLVVFAIAIMIPNYKLRELSTKHMEAHAN